MMDKLLEQRQLVARRVAQPFAAHPMVVSVIVFGSVATGTVDEDSDVDMLVFCHPHLIPAVERHKILQEVGSGWALSEITGSNLFAVADEGGIVDGIPVTVHYQLASWIESVLSAVLEQGAITTELLPFRPYTLPALLQRGWLLYDDSQLVKEWRERAKLYPALLKHNIMQHFEPILREETEELVAAAKRELGPRNFLFHLNRSVDALLSILYALNELYDPADRRAAQNVWPFLKVAPADFGPCLTTILEGPFDSEGMKRQAQRYSELVCETMMLMK